jgi:hypothetical protein
MAVETRRDVRRVAARRKRRAARGAAAGLLPLVLWLAAWYALWFGQLEGFPRSDPGRLAVRVQLARHRGGERLGTNWKQLA